MTHYQYKGGSVLKMSSLKCHDLTNYVRYMWFPILIFMICLMICYHTLCWSVTYALQISKPDPKIEYPIESFANISEPKKEIKQTIKKEKKK